jgi:hypothetical protein
MVLGSLDSNKLLPPRPPSGLCRLVLAHCTGAGRASAASERHKGQLNGSGLCDFVSGFSCFWEVFCFFPQLSPVYVSEWGEWVRRFHFQRSDFLLFDLHFPAMPCMLFSTSNPQSACFQRLVVVWRSTSRLLPLKGSAFMSLSSTVESRNALVKPRPGLGSFSHYVWEFGNYKCIGNSNLKLAWSVHAIRKGRGTPQLLRSQPTVGVAAVVDALGRNPLGAGPIVHTHLFTPSLPSFPMRLLIAALRYRRVCHCGHGHLRRHAVVPIRCGHALLWACGVHGRLPAWSRCVGGRAKFPLLSVRFKLLALKRAEGASR